MDHLPPVVPGLASVSAELCCASSGVFSPQGKASLPLGFHLSRGLHPLHRTHCSFSFLPNAFKLFAWPNHLSLLIKLARRSKTSALNSDISRRRRLQGPLSASETGFLWTLLLWVVFPAMFNPFIAKWALQKCLEPGHSIEEKYLNLQKAPPLSLFTLFLPGVADSSQILVDSKEIQKTKNQFIKQCNNWKFKIFQLLPTWKSTSAQLNSFKWNEHDGGFIKVSCKIFYNHIRVAHAAPLLSLLPQFSPVSLRQKWQFVLSNGHSQDVQKWTDEI